MKTNTKNFFRQLWVWVFLLIPLFKTMAQQPTYIQGMKYTDVAFSVYFAHCDNRQVTYTLNGNPFPVTTVFASGGFIANRFPYGILKVGDVFKVTNTCDGTSVSTVVQDDFSYVEVPNGNSYTGNGISATDSDPPYNRLQTPVQVGQCEVMKNINAHILDSYFVSMNDAITFGKFKHNGIPIVQSDYNEDHYGQSVTWHINPDGSVYTDNATKLTSIQLYSGAIPQTFSYTHNGATIISDLTISFGGLAIRYIKNGSYSIEKSTAAGLQRTDYQGAFNNSTFEIRYNNVSIEAWVNGVKIDQLNKDVQYTVSGGGTLSNTAVLSYGTPVDFTPTTQGDYIFTAIVNGIRKVEQKFHIASKPNLSNTVINANCSALGAITATGNGGFGALQYNINGGAFSSNNTFGNLSPGNYTLSVKDASGCVFNNNVNVTSTGQNPNLSLASTACSADLKTYSIAFASDGTVTTTAGTVSGSTVTGIPAGTNVTLTATSSAGCQTTLAVNAPNCACPTVNAPISGGNQTTTCVGAAIPAISVTVNAGETADWYDAPTGGNLLASATTTYQATQSGTYYAQARNMTTGCISASRTSVTVSQNALPSLSLINATCAADLKTYQVSFTSDGTVSSTVGTVSGSIVTGIPAGTNVTLTATSSAGCQTTLNVNAPNCACPNVNAPISGGDQTATCVGTAIPAISVTVNAGETADWYDAPTGGNLLASNTTTYQATQSQYPLGGTFYAQARNTTTGCISASRTGVTVSQNALPSLTLASTACSADLKTYQVSFTSDGTVSSTSGTVSGTMVTGIPAGTNVTLTATSSAGCQTTLAVNAPNCTCPTVNAPISGGDQTATCVGAAIPAISVTVNTGETADWYDAPTGGNLLATATTSYQANSGTYYAQARNTTTGCISASRTSVTVSQNALPSLALINATCAADLKTYSISFSSDGTVSSTSGIVSGNTVTEIPAGTNVTLTATSSANCKTTLVVNAPNCACPTVNAPISGGNQTTTCVGTAIPAISVTVNAGETADWYDAPTGGNFVETASTSYQPTQQGTFYAVARNTTTGCISASRTSVTVSQNALPSLSLVSATCAADLKTYQVNFITDGLVSASTGTLSGNTVTGITTGTNMVLTATSSAGCQTTLNVNAPNCACPNVNAPISGGDQTTTCVGTAIPAILVTVNAGETADWYDAPTGGNLLATASTTYQATQSGTYYAQARNTTTNCVSANRTAVTVSQNALPSLSITSVACSADLKSYSINFNSNATVTSSVGTVSAGTVSGIPTGTNIALTATSSAGCQTTLNVNAPNCACPNVNAPISGGDQTTTCVGTAIPAISVTVNAGETADWYDAPTGGNLLASATTTYQANSGTYYAQARNTTTNCISASRTGVTVSQNALPSITLVNASCATDLKTYQVNFTTNGLVSASTGTLSGNTVTGISTGTNIALTATSSAGCQTTLNVNAPNCACPNVNAPISGGDQTATCVGTAIPAISVTVNAGETADWYDAPTEGNLLASATTTYQATQGGTYYAEARNTTTGCISASRTGVTVSQNALPSLSITGASCSVDLKTYSVAFASDGTVTATAGMISGSMVTGIPAGTNVTLTATSSAGCQTTLKVNAPNCACPTVNAPISGGNQTSTCVGAAIPAISVTVNADETADWYDAPTGGNLLASNTNQYQATQVGTYYAEAKNTTTGCISASRTGITITVNGLPTLSATEPICTLDNRTYSFSFSSNGKVSTNVGTITGNTITGVPTGTNVILTATSSAGCQATLKVNAPKCANCVLKVSADATNISQGQTTNLHASGCNGGYFVWENTGKAGTDISVKPLSTTTYKGTCSFIPGVIQCAAEITITVNPCQLSATVSKEKITQGESVTLSASGCENGYLIWAGSNSELSTIQVKPLETTTYTAQCWYSTGVVSCSISKTIKVIPCQLSATASSEEINQGESVTLSASGCENGYLIWTGSNSELPTITVTPNLTTTYTAQCWYSTGVASCNISKTIKVIPCQLSATASSENITKGESVTLSASGCKNGYLLWEGTNSELSTVRVTPWVTTTYTAKCWYATGNGTGNESCSISKTITVSPCHLTAFTPKASLTLGESLSIASTGCIGNLLYPQDTTQNGKSVFAFVPTKTQDFTIQCQVGNVISCDTTVHINVEPCHLSATTEKASLTLGESLSIASTGCIGNLLYPQDTTQNGKSVFAFVPTKTQDFTIQCKIGNIISCDTNIHITVEPCHLSAIAEKASVMGGETLSITSTGCIGTLIYPQDTTQNGKSVFSYLPNKTQTYTVQCKIGNIISCDTTISIVVDKCPAAIQATATTIIKGDYTTLSYQGCPNTVVWKDLGTGTNKRVNPTKATTYYASCNYGDKLQYSCSSDSIVIKVRPKQPILDNNRLGTSGIALQDTICLNSDLLMQMNCEQGAKPYWNGKALNQLKVDASQVGIQTYQFYCQNDDDGEKSDESFATVLVKGFEIEDAIVYPNPTTGILRIKSTGCLDNLHLVLYTLYGQVLYQGNGENRTSDSISIDLTYLPSNEYVLHITGKQGANEMVTKRMRVIKYSK